MNKELKKAFDSTDRALGKLRAAIAELDAIASTTLPNCQIVWQISASRDIIGSVGRIMMSAQVSAAALKEEK